VVEKILTQPFLPLFYRNSLPSLKREGNELIFDKKLRIGMGSAKSYYIFLLVKVYIDIKINE